MWIYLRHYINLTILWAVLTEFRTVGPYKLDWELQQYKCSLSQVITFALLASLQAVNLFWLFLILRIAKNYIMSNVKADERSEYEESEDETEKAREKEKKLLQETETDSEKPVLLVNGEAVDGDKALTQEVRQTRSKGRERKKDR